MTRKTNKSKKFILKIKKNCKNLFYVSCLLVNKEIRNVRAKLKKKRKETKKTITK